MMQATQYLPYLIIACCQFERIGITRGWIWRQRRQTNKPANRKYAMNLIVTG